MFKNLHLQIKQFLLEKHLPHRRNLLLAMVLAFSLGSAGQTTPAQAAPAERRIRVEGEITVTLPPDPICAGRSYPITAKLANNEYTQEGFDDTPAPFTSEPISGIQIRASTGDGSIATIDPPQLWSGWAIDDDAPGEVTFHLHAVKAGETTLNFRATVNGDTRGPVKTIKVKNCDYKVTMNAFDVFSGGGITIWTFGNLDTKITGEGGELKGTGSFVFDSGFSGSDCSISYSQYQNQTTITGHVDDNNQLLLNFQYEPGGLTESASCPEGGGSSSHSIDLTNTGVTSATFPATGGTKVVTFTYAGSDFPPGTMIINVWPVSPGD